MPAWINHKLKHYDDDDVGDVGDISSAIFILAGQKVT